MPKLHGRKKRQLHILLLLIAVLLTAAAVLFFALRPIADAPDPAHTPDITATPPQSASPAPSATPEASAAPIQAALSRYDAVLTVEPAANSLTGRLRLTYVNRYAESLFSVVLNLFPNAVKPGCLSLFKVTAEGLNADYTLSTDGTHLTVPLMRELKPGESTLLYVEYAVLLPKTNDRFGVGENRLMLGNCIPIAAVYENGAWREDAYIDTGDSFYSEVADYRVAISAPEAYTLSCTGSVTEQTSENGVTTAVADAREVRDFAFSLHKNAAVETLEQGGVKVTGVARTKESAQLAAQYGASAVAYFSDKIGAYPYERLCVVDFNGSGGMEYPGLVMIDATLLNVPKEEYAAMVIAHEVAHQWFYGIVGSDQLFEPWVDESLVEFLGFDCIRGTLGDDVYADLWLYSFRNYETYERTLPLNAPLSSFQDGNDYFFVIYAYGAHVMRELHDELGENAFYGALQTYFYEHGYQNATGGDLIAAFSEAAGKDMTQWFEERFLP